MHTNWSSFQTIADDIIYAAVNGIALRKAKKIWMQRVENKREREGSARSRALNYNSISYRYISYYQRISNRLKHSQINRHSFFAAFVLYSFSFLIHLNFVLFISPGVSVRKKCWKFDMHRINGHIRHKIKWEKQRNTKWAVESRRIWNHTIQFRNYFLLLSFIIVVVCITFRRCMQNCKLNLGSVEERAFLSLSQREPTVKRIVLCSRI